LTNVNSVVLPATNVESNSIPKRTATIVVPNEGPRMTRLTTAQIQNLARLMVDCYAHGLHEIDAVAARSREGGGAEVLSGRYADDFDAALAEPAIVVDDAVAAKDTRDLRDIAAARKRISAGVHGVCFACGESTGYERLLAFPTAKRCIECQRTHELYRANPWASRAL
jgi:RNA polymerase-binding transcription factor DksA